MLSMAEEPFFDAGFISDDVFDADPAVVTEFRREVGFTFEDTGPKKRLGGLQHSIQFLLLTQAFL